MTDEPAIEAAVAAAEGTLGPVDVLVNCAGILENAETTHDMDLAYHDKLWRVNYWGTLFCSRVVARGMLERKRGAILEGARHEFLSHGYTATSMDRIARAAAVLVVTATWEINFASTPIVLPPLKPNQPNHSTKQPIVARDRL